MLLLKIRGFIPSVNIKKKLCVIITIIIILSLLSPPTVNMIINIIASIIMTDDYEMDFLVFGLRSEGLRSGGGLAQLVASKLINTMPG